MGVIKVETIDRNDSAGGTLTLSNTLASTSSGFIRNPNVRNMSGGPTGSTGSEGPDACSIGAYISSTTQVTFVNPNSLNQKYMAEVWRYTGAASGPDEFIVRDRKVVTLGANVENNSVAISGITDRNKCICFITGKTTAQASNSLWQEAMAIAYLDASDNLVVSRQDTNAAAMDVYVTVVEFTGSNWTVAYCRRSFGTGSSNLVDDSRGNTGNTVDIGDWSKAMIIDAQLEGDSGSNNAIEDRSYTASPGSTTQVSITKDTTSANNGDAMIYVLAHPNMVIARQTASKTIPNNNSYDTSLIFPSITVSDLTEAALEFTCFSDGTGTAHARGCLSAILTGTSQISTWCHRSGNGGSYAYGVAVLTSIDGTVPCTITDVDSDNIITNTQTNVVITGAEFGTSQGTGKVELVQNFDYTGTKVEQTSIDSWGDTTIQFDASAGALADTNCYLFVTTDDAKIGSIAVQVGLPPETYSDVVEGLIGGLPDHWWKLQNDYDDDGNSSDNRPMTQSVVGTHEFDTSPELVRGETYALRWDSNTDSRRIADVNDMNGQTETARTFGTWVSFNSIQKSLNCFYNEGGSVNNACFIMGVGNKLLAQFADTGDDNVHVYSDFALDINRPYFIVWAFDYGGDDEFKFWIDAIKQGADNGNPLTSSDLDAHSGDVVFGKPETNLEVFGTDITFDGNEYMWSAHWFSYTRELTQTELTELFEKGAPAKHTISTDTEANMQLDVDALADTEIDNYPIGIQFEKCTAGDFDIEFDNITFDPRCTFEISYLGVDELTITKLNGTEIDTNKISTPYGGTVTIVSTVITTITGVPAGAEWRLYEDSATAGVIGTVLLDGTESKVGAGDILYSDIYSTDTDVVLQVIADGYEEFLVYFTLEANPQTVVVDLIPDTNI